MNTSIDRFKQIFRENLERFRKDAGYTQVELSEASGFEASYVGKLERGEADPSLESIRKITGALDRSPEELLLPDADHDSDGEVDMEDKLKIHEVELEMQQEELDRTEEKLRRSRDRYRSRFERAPFPLVTVREDGTIIEANHRFHDIFVRGDNRPEGDHINGFVHPADRDAFYQYRKEAGDESDSDPVVLRFGNPGENVRFYRVKSSSIDSTEDGNTLLLSFQDVDRWMNESEPQDQ